jgi:hypothetical protein
MREGDNETVVKEGDNETVRKGDQIIRGKREEDAISLKFKGCTTHYSVRKTTSREFEE